MQSQWIFARRIILGPDDPLIGAGAASTFITPFMLKACPGKVHTYG